MSVELKDLWIRPCTSMGDIREFVEIYHYSKSVKGITPFLCFEVVLRHDFQKQVGAIILGAPGQINTELKYGEYSKDEEKFRPGVVAVELRRFVLLDELPRNSESWILGKLLKMLAAIGVERIISYADPNQQRAEHPDGKHTGLIYRAAGFRRERDAGNTKAIIILEDFEMDGKVFKKDRRLPIRNLDQYRNFRVWKKADLPPQILIDWEEASRIPNRYGKGFKAIVWMEGATGKSVYVIKTEKYLTSLSKRLRAAVGAKKAKLQSEEGKILYIKDLEQQSFLPCELECSLEEEKA